MELFHELFAGLLLFVYHCFDRIYYDATKDGKALILDHYTGVGEVLAVHNLPRCSRHFTNRFA